MLSILRQRSIRVLWTGLVLSAVGDEFYGVAVVWVAVSLMGTGAGYVVAIRAAAVLLAGLVAGVWTDRWDPRRTMIVADCCRGGAVFVLPLLALFLPLSLWTLVPVIVIVSALQAFFDPALYASLPSLAASRQSLQAVNALVDGTRRLARAVGPALVALIHAVLPLIHFFTLNALSFGASAIALALLGRDLPRRRVVGPAPTGHVVADIAQRVLAGFKAVRGHSLMQYLLIGHGVVNAGWYIGLILATALRLQRESTTDVGAYGLVIAAYGLGNIVSNVVVASWRIECPVRMMWNGRLIAGAGFVGLALSPTLPGMMTAAFVAAVGALLTQIPFLLVLQTGFRGVDVARVYRLRMISEWGAVLLGLLASPLLFATFSPTAVVVGCGGLIAAVGVIGFFLFDDDWLTAHELGPQPS